MLTNDQETLTVAALQSYEDVGWPAPMLLLDNGAGRDSESVRERFSHHLDHDLQVFGEGTNFGVAGGRNYLARRAASDWLVFVDNDVLFTAEILDFIGELGRSGADVVLPIILSSEGRVWSAGGRYRPWLSWSRSGFSGAAVESARRDLRRNADWGAGACLSVRRSTFEALGGFDAGQHGLYGAEDIDFCLRTSKSGGTTARSAAAPVVHLDVGAGADPERRYQHVRKSSARVRAAHGVWITRYPSAWFWYLRRAPGLDPVRRSIRSTGRRLKAVPAGWAGRTPAVGEHADGRAGTCVLAWGALPPPVHGSAIVNTVVHGVIERAARGYWVNAATGDLAELERVNARKTLATLGRMTDYTSHAVRWARGYTAYLSMATTPPALYRDLVIWTIGAVTSRRTVIHVHTGDLSGLRPRGPFAPLQRRLLRRSEFWVLGAALVASPRALGALSVHVVHNGVTCESRYHGEGRQSPEGRGEERGEACSSADGGDIRVVFLSNHFLSKGVDVSAELAEALKDEPFAWTFAGRAVEADTEALLRPLERLGARYRRIEAIDSDARCRLLHRSDVLILPSRYPHEASPLVIIEAMEHGVIPIVSSRGCMPEIVGEAGSVCDTLDEYLEALRLVASDRRGLASKSVDASSRWRARYSRAAFEHRVAELLSGTAAPEAGDYGQL
jgi:glycosyltransferase involved in cell wall biosynthesis/GT2 family glycosyltransferase